MMTFKEFREMTYGVKHYHIYFRGELFIGKEVYDFDNYFITEFEFVTDSTETITCALDVVEKID
jgi:hypothetical protein